MLVTEPVLTLTMGEFGGALLEGMGDDTGVPALVCSVVATEEVPAAVVAPGVLVKDSDVPEPEVGAVVVGAEDVPTALVVPTVLEESMDEAEGEL